VPNRREFLRLSIGAAWMAQAPPLDFADAPQHIHPNLKRWWPRFPLAQEIWVLPFAADAEEGMILETAAGLAGRAALHGDWRTLIYEHVDNEGYQRAFNAYCQAHSPRLLSLTLDEMVDRLHRARIVRGYLLYRYETSPRALNTLGTLEQSAKLDESANVATSLAASQSGLVVSERLAQRLERLGLKCLRDVREVTEAACWQQESRHFSRQVLGTCDPKARHVRSLMIALDAFVCSGRGDVYHQALARCQPDAPILGWGCGAEDAQTIPSSRFGLFQTATNWCHNLPVFAGESVSTPIPTSQLRTPTACRWADLDWGDGYHYATFVMSDGDNVQWVMGNFFSGSEGRYYYGDPQRGHIPLGWGIPGPSLLQLAPRTLQEIFTRATPNDDFIFYNGGGYFYPDLYGKEPGHTEALAVHAQRLRGSMEQAGVRTLAFNFQQWDSPAALAACATIATHLPELAGILAFQYDSYSAGNGAIRWVPGHAGEEIPVASCRLCIWAQTGRERETTPAGVAAWLNTMPVLGEAATSENFSWVIAHAWSRFREAEVGAPLLAEESGVPQDRDTPGSTRGYTPVLWAVQRLAPHVKVITPQEWLLRIRLRLRPQATLTSWSRETEMRLHHYPNLTKSHSLLAKAKTLLPQTGNSVIARQCFEQLKEAYLQLPPHR